MVQSKWRLVVGMRKGAMEVRTYQASTMQQALKLVRDELGPSAVILESKEVGGSRWLSWLTGKKRVEISASPVAEAKVPVPDNRTQQHADLQTLVAGLSQKNGRQTGEDWTPTLFQLFTDLVDAEMEEATARELVSQLKADTPKKHWNQEEVLRTRLTRLVETSLRVCGPVKITPGGRRVVALIGPTGVGKTTTIAKLAANHRLREKQRVGLITVDTYRIAAVEQLRTYADIIDLPMKVVATPSEMREAMRDFDQMELVLIDTAGRSPRDDGKLQELRDFLAEAQADEVHLVLSAVGSRGSLIRAAERFKTVGATSLIMTKLDEAASLGMLLPLVQASQLPLSYVTNGQSVPDDIAIAESGRLANSILHVE